MPLGKMVIRVNIQLDASDPNSIVTLDDTLDIEVQIQKDTLAYQNSAAVNVVGLSTALRQTLLTRYSEYQLNRVVSGRVQQNIFSPVTIEAGYETRLQNGTVLSSVSTVFKGELAYVQPTSPPPDIGVMLVCYTNQINKTAWITQNSLPGSCTFLDMVNWAAQQFELATAIKNADGSFTPTRKVNVICTSRYQNTIITNPGSSFREVGALAPALMQYFWPFVCVYYDDDTLYVRDRGDLDNSVPLYLNKFIGTPMWSKNGVTATVMFNESMRLWSSVNIISALNPSLGPNQNVPQASATQNSLLGQNNVFGSTIAPTSSAFVLPQGNAQPNFMVGSLDMHLTSRKAPFYTSFEAYVANPAVTGDA
jgi:hypothetical protein